MKGNELLDTKNSEFVTINSFSFSAGDFPLNIIDCGKTQQLKMSTIIREKSPFYIIEYIVSGSGTLIYGKNKYKVSQGDVWILHRGSKHIYYPDEDNMWQKIFINLDGILLTSLIMAYDLNDVCWFVGFNNEAIFQEFYNVADSGMPYDQMNSKLGIILHKIIQECYYINQQSVQVVSAGRIKRVLESSIFSPQFQLKELAASMHISHAQLINIFKKEYDTTPYKYLIELRIKTSADMLINTNMSIGKITEQLNFYDQHYYSNVFKKVMGMSPINYRKEHKNMSVTDGATVIVKNH